MPKIKTAVHLLRNPYALLAALGRNGLLNWMPDERYLRIAYRAHMQKKLNLENPRLYTEKLQWLKLYDRDPLYTTLVDKYSVRKYVENKIGRKHLVPLYGVFNTFDEIDWEKLPDEFIMKCTHGCGFNIICNDKSSFDFTRAKKRFNKWLSINPYWATREWPYKNVKPRIIIEKLLKNNTNPLVDYKFYCFHGKPYYCKLQFIYQGTKYQNYMDIDFHDTGVRDEVYPPHEYYIPRKSKYYEQIVEIAETLSQGFKHVRIDFLVTDDNFYVGEFTFFTTSGYSKFTPSSFNETLGSLLTL
jgi:hypothetical protein